LRVRDLAAIGLTKAQNLDIYRWVGRRLAGQVVVREASEEDVQAIYELWAGESFHVASSEKSPKLTYWVGMIRDNYAGFVELVRNPLESSWGGYWLYGLWVRRSWRGLGLGEKLVRAVVERSCIEGSEKLDLMVYEDNAGAVSLYHKLGFVHITFPEIEPQLLSEQQTSGRRRLVMRKWLGKN